MLLAYLICFLAGIITVLLVQNFSPKRPDPNGPSYSYINESVAKAIAEQKRLQEQHNQQPISQTPTPIDASTSAPSSTASTPGVQPKSAHHSNPPVERLSVTASSSPASSLQSPSTPSQEPKTKLADNLATASSSSTLRTLAAAAAASDQTPTTPSKQLIPGSPPEVPRSKTRETGRTKSGTFFSFPSSSSPSLNSSLGKYFTASNILMKGYLEIRAISMVWNKRFFLLYTDESQGWISYFKNEQMKRADCYGHIKVKNCIVKKQPSKNTFEIVNVLNRCIFSVDGPPSHFTPASTSHRIFRLSSTECLLKAPDGKCLDEWVRNIESAVKMAPMGAKEEDDDEEPIPNDLELVASVEELGLGAAASAANLTTVGEPELAESPPAPAAVTASSSGSGLNSGTGSSSSGTPVVLEAPQVQRTEDELKAIRKLRQMIPDLIEERNIDEGMLCRFAKARAYEPKATIEMLTNYFTWRDEYKPENIEPSQIISEIAKQKATFYGYDKFDRPVLVAWAVRHIPKESDVEVFMRFIIYIIESAIAHMKAPVYQFTAILDLKDWGTSNFDMTTTKVAAHMLQAFYPERMGVVMLVNTPWILKKFWSFINPLLDERTRKKIRFLDNVGQIQEFVSAEALPRSLGGTCDWRPPTDSVGLETLQPGWTWTSS